MPTDMPINMSTNVSINDTNDTLLQLRNLAVSYVPRQGNPIRVVDGVTLDMHRAEIVGVLGESGCGKSTLAGAILQLLRPNARYESGEIVFRGRDLLKMSEADLRPIRGREISMIGQDPAISLNPVIPVGFQVGEVLRAHLPLNAEQRRAQVLEGLNDVGFDQPQQVYPAYPHQLSGGQRQRIAIAQAIACRPALLIADEPTSKLDVTLQWAIIALLAQVRKKYGTSILIISHDPSLFAGFADRIAVMYAGRVVEIAGTAQIFARPLHPYTQALVRIAAASVLASSNLASTALDAFDPKTRLPAIAGESPDPACFPAGCRFEPRCMDRMDVCTQSYPREFIPEASRPVHCFKYGE